MYEVFNDDFQYADVTLRNTALEERILEAGDMKNTGLEARKAKKSKAKTLKSKTVKKPKAKTSCPLPAKGKTGVLHRLSTKFQNEYFLLLY